MPHGEHGRRQPGTLTACVLLLATFVLSAFAAGPGTLGWDLALSRAVQTLDSSVAHDLEAVGSGLGSTIGIVAIGAVLAVGLLLRRRWWDAGALLAAVALTRANVLLKHTFASPRPTEAQVEVRTVYEFYGFPSGHTSATVLLVGVALAVLLPLLTAAWQRAVAWMVAVATVATVGFARIHSGAHWPSDVVGGLLWGLLGVWALLLVRGWLRRWWTDRATAALYGVPTAGRRYAK